MTRHHLARRPVADGLEFPLAIDPIEVAHMQALWAPQGLDAIIDQSETG
jgi:hypothetical protein